VANLERVGAVAVGFVLAVMLAGPALAVLPPGSLRLQVAVEDGVIVVTVSNGGVYPLESVFLEAPVPEGVDMTPEQGAVVGGVWRYSVEALPGGTEMTVRLRFVAAEPHAGSTLEVTARASGVPAQTAQVSLPPTPPDAFPLVALLVAAVLALLAAGVVTRRQPVEHAFLLHRSGMLIAAKGRALRDADLLGGMLVVVQQSIKRGLADPAAVLQEMRFNGKTLVLVHGANTLVAAVTDGAPRLWLRHRLRTVVAGFERANPLDLTRWNGDLGRLEGVDRALAGL